MDFCNFCCHIYLHKNRNVSKKTKPIKLHNTPFYLLRSSLVFVFTFRSNLGELRMVTKILWKLWRKKSSGKKTWKSTQNYLLGGVVLVAKAKLREFSMKMSQFLKRHSHCRELGTILLKVKLSQSKTSFRVKFYFFSE